MPKALSTVGDRQRFCQEQRPVLAEQVSGMEHDAFHVPVSSNKTLEAAFNGQARTRRPSASTAVAARARPRGPRAGPSPPTTAGETGCGRPPTAAAAAAADKPAQAEPLACIPTRMLSVPWYREHALDQGFPAHAGMDPIQPASARPRARLPRTRGAGPWKWLSGLREEWASPHTRGWTRGPSHCGDGARGFPAHAGMDPIQFSSGVLPWRLPRTRGDGPVVSSRSP